MVQIISSKKQIKKLSKKTTVGIIIVTFFIFLIILIAGTGEKNKKTASAPLNIVSNTAIEEPFEITVTSLIVKSVNGKYRYFFDIRNQDEKDFSGRVLITLYNNKQNGALGEDAFDTASPIKPGLGNSLYFDINTGPTSVHGEYGITKFKYSVIINGATVKSGEGNITDKFE